MWASNIPLFYNSTFSSVAYEISLTAPLDVLYVSNWLCKSWTCVMPYVCVACMLNRWMTNVTIFCPIKLYYEEVFCFLYICVPELRNFQCTVKNNLLLCSQTTDLSVFETNIRFIGGLLTCFALTGDVMFRDKAEQVAKKLLPAFQTQTGLPHSLINIKTGVKILYTFLIKEPCMCVCNLFLIIFKWHTSLCLSSRVLRMRQLEGVIFSSSCHWGSKAYLSIWALMPFWSVFVLHK